MKEPFRPIPWLAGADAEESEAAFLRCLTAEQTNILVDGVAADTLDRPHPERDLLMPSFSMATADCISELVRQLTSAISISANAEFWCEAKASKERQVPYGSKAAAALENISQFATLR